MSAVIRRAEPAVARHGRELGAIWLVWDVRVENETAKAFYERIGAKPYDEVRTMTLKGAALEALAAEPE